MTDIVTAGLAERIVSAARTSVGDQLRTVVLFTPANFDVLYVRTDLYESTEQAREVKGRLVAFERVGFGEVPVRTAVSGAVGDGIGPYAFTVRFHEDGFVVRVIEGDLGVLLTTDGVNANGFEEAAAAIRRLLADHAA
jgi:hypothetical protein